MFRGPRQSRKVKIIKISGGRGGRGGWGGVNGGGGGLGEGPRVKIVAPRTVTNINKNYSTASAVPSGFRMIPLGDIDLQREIQLDMVSGVVNRRKLHSAKLLGAREKSDITVAVYQGAGAKQQWRRDIARYMAVRHPNILQLYGTAAYGNIHVAVFHDDLIPYREFLNLYWHLHFSRAYIYLYMHAEFEATQDYLLTALEHSLSTRRCTLFIRRSTGRLSVDLVGDGLKFLALDNSEATIIDSLTLDQYHSTCYWDFSVYQFLSLSPLATANLGSVYNWPSDNTFDDLVEIAWLPNIELWSDHTCGQWSFGQLMADGWTRLKLNDIVATQVWVGFPTYNHKFWLSQANHIFTALQISSNFQDYVAPHCVHFKLTISASEADMPKGFLFLCPPEHFKTGQSSLKWPDCPAYWSLDPSGVEQLTLEDAIRLGFPSFHLSTEVEGYSWDASVYAGLRQFHNAKGFDPDSQDVARHLGHKLYKLSGPYAHIDEYSEDGDDTSQWSTDEEFDDGPDSTPMDHDFVRASTHQDMDEVRVSSVFEKNIDSTSASTAPSLLSRNWETSAAFRYGYDMQPNQSLSTSDLSTSIFGFDTHDFGNNLSWPDSFVSNDPDPSLSSLAQLLPATSLPQFPTSLIAASSFSSAPVVDAPIAGSNLNYQPPMLDDAAQFFSATSLPQLPTSLPAASSFAIAPAVVDTTSTTSRKRKRRDETDTDRANMIQGNARTEGSEAL